MQEIQAEVSRAVNGVNELAGKYLTFKLGPEEYGLEILKVREIIGLMDITAIPRTPSFVRGVINLRGKVIPVVDLRSKFEMDTVEETETTCIIVVEVMKNVKSIEMGVLVDSVSEVLDINGVDIEEAPSLGSIVDTDFILGMAKVKGGVKILLDINKVMASNALHEITDVLAEA